MQLSIIVLTHNSEETIADTLESLKGIGDEVLIIDSGSSDRTVEIAQRLKARVLEHEFSDFSSQRNFAADKARGKWLLYIDSDEQVTGEFKKEVQAILTNHDINSGVGGYFIYRKTFYYGIDWNMSDKVQRLFYKPDFISWHGTVHETPKIKGKFGIIESPILHFTHNNLTSMVEKTNVWSEYEAKLRIKANHPKMTVWRFFRVMITAFFKSYIGGKGYKNGTAGVIEAIYQSFSMFITYAKLWELQNKKSE